MEIEIKLKVTKESWNQTKEIVEKTGTNKKEKIQHDIYFSPENINFFGTDKNDECLRIRIQNNKYLLSYKKIVFGTSEEDIHLIEHEVPFENLEEMKNLLSCMRIHEVLTLNKKRTSYIYKEIAEISFDEVKDLGYFIELEILDSSDIGKSNKMLKEIIESLHLNMSDRDLTGYANALYNLKKDEK